MTNDSHSQFITNDVYWTIRDHVWLTNNPHGRFMIHSIYWTIRDSLCVTKMSLCVIKASVTSIAGLTSSETVRPWCKVPMEVAPPVRARSVTTVILHDDRCLIYILQIEDGMI